MSASNQRVGGLVLGLVIGMALGAIGYRALTGSTSTADAGPVDEGPVPALTAPAPAPAPQTEPAAPPPAETPAVLAEAEPPTETNRSPEEIPEEPDANRARADRIAQAQMKLLSDMVYKPFYEEVGLDPDTRSAAAELLAESFGKQQRIQQQAMAKGEQTASEIKAQTDALRDELREKLVGVLNEDQLASWEEYDAYSDRVLFEALLDGQLRMLAPELSIESHQEAMAVMAEELAISIDTFENSSTLYNLDNFNDAQYRGLVTAMQRLQSELDTEQAAHAQGFVDEAKAMFDAMKGPPPR